MMENADREVSVVRRLEKAVTGAGTEREADSLKKSLGIARTKLARKRASIINSAPPKHADFTWENVPRSTLTDEDKVKIIKDFGIKKYLSMPL